MKLLTAADAARLIGVPTIQLRRARERGAGPPAIMLNGVGYIYDADAVQAWLDNGGGPDDLRAGTGRELRPHPRGTDEWFNLATGEWCPINRATDPRYRRVSPGCYNLKDEYR